MHKIQEALDVILGNFLHDAFVKDIRVASLTGVIDIDFGLGSPSEASIRLRFTGVHSFAYEVPPSESGCCGTYDIRIVKSSEAAFRLQSTWDNFGLEHFHIQMLGRPGSLLREEYRTGIHVIAERCEAFYV